MRIAPHTSRRTRWAATLAVAVSLAPRVAKTQTTDAECLPEWDWASNSKDQSPCLIAAYLLNQCNTGQWNVPAIRDGQMYAPPNLTQATVCQCSSVTFSLLAACGQCQGGLSSSWSGWRTNCTNENTSVGSYPFEIPPESAVPAWAFLDVTETDQFDEGEARRASALPESTGGQPSSGTSTRSSTSSGSSSSSTTSTTTTSTTSDTALAGLDDINQSSGGRNVGAIVGGTVGAVLGLSLILLLALYLFRKKRTAPSAAFTNSIQPDAATAGFRTASTVHSPLASDPVIRPGSSTGVFQLGFTGNPWSPPPPSSTPSRAMSPTSLSTYGYQQSGAHSLGVSPSFAGATIRRNAYDYSPPNSSESFALEPSVSSIRSTVPMVQYSNPHPVIQPIAHPYNPHPYYYGSSTSPPGSHSRQTSASRPEI